MSKEQGEPPVAFQLLGEAWEALFRANEAFVAVDATGSREYARVGLRILERRTHEFLTALTQVMEVTSE